MDSTIALGYVVYMGVAYVLAYMVYLQVKSVKTNARTGFGCAPYDSDHIILKRRCL
jgi:hypothetical protein